MHTRHCPRHVLAAPPAHFSGIYVTATWGKFYTGDGWRAAPVEQRMSELHRVVESGVEGCERDGPEGRRLCFGTWAEGGGETYCLRTKHLPQKPPLPSRVPSALSPSLHRSTLYIYLWYRFTRDLATDDGIPSRRERKKKRGRRPTIGESG